MKQYIRLTDYDVTNYNGCSNIKIVRFYGLMVNNAFFILTSFGWSTTQNGRCYEINAIKRNIMKTTILILLCGSKRFIEILIQFLRYLYSNVDPDRRSRKIESFPMCTHEDTRRIDVLGKLVAPLRRAGVLTPFTIDSIIPLPFPPLPRSSR